MNSKELNEIIVAQLGYVPMRILRSEEYHDGISFGQIERWRSEWYRGAMFGLINPVPDYTPNSFACGDAVEDFIAFCRRKNAYTKKALPMCYCALPGHAVVLFCDDDQTLRLYDPRDGTTPLIEDVDINFIGGM